MAKKKHSIRIKNKNSNRVHVVNNINLGSTGKKKQKSGPSKKPTSGQTIIVNVPNSEPRTNHQLLNPFYAEHSQPVKEHIPIPVHQSEVPEIVHVPNTPHSAPKKKHVLSSEETENVVIKRKRINDQVPDRGPFVMPPPRGMPSLPVLNTFRPLHESQFVPNPMMMPEVTPRSPISGGGSSSGSRSRSRSSSSGVHDGQVMNPLSRRWIKINSYTHRKLMREGYL